MEGEGGARKAAGWGLGARDLAGEKCCWRVEKEGFLGWEEERRALVVGGSAEGSRVVGSRDGGGRRAVEDVKRVEEDLVRV